MSLRVDLNDQTICANLHAEQHNEVNAAVLGLQSGGGGGGGGGGYASLIGFDVNGRPGDTYNPGDLMQQGGLWVAGYFDVQSSTPEGGINLSVNDTRPIVINDVNGAGVFIYNNSDHAGLGNDQGIAISTWNQMTLAGVDGARIELYTANGGGDINLTTYDSTLPGGPGRVLIQGNFEVVAPNQVQTNVVVQESEVQLYAGDGQVLALNHGGSNDIDITHVGSGNIQLRAWGTGGINLTTGQSTPGDIAISQYGTGQLNLMQFGTGGLTIACPGTGDPDVDTGQIYITAPYGVFITGGSGGHGDISLHSPVFAWDGLIAQGSGVSVDGGQLYVQNASVYINSVGGITVQDTASFYLQAPTIDLVSGSGSNQWVSARGGFRTYATGNDGVNIQADGAGGLVVQNTGTGPMSISQGGTGALNYLQVQSQGDLLLYTPNRLGFFATNVTGNKATQQAVSGSRGGNAALASLLIALANYGLIVNNTAP